MKVTLYVIPGSHPGVAARLMLERKGVDYRRIDQRFRSEIEGRPSGALATRVVSAPPGRVPAAFPGEWLAPLRAGAPA
jgi:hypothetical protein